MHGDCQEPGLGEVADGVVLDVANGPAIAGGD